MSDAEEIAAHKATMRRMDTTTRYYYMIGYISGEVRSDWPTPAKKLRHIRLLIQTHDELLQEETPNAG